MQIDTGIDEENREQIAADAAGPREDGVDAARCPRVGQAVPQKRYLAVWWRGAERLDAALAESLPAGREPPLRTHGWVSRGDTRSHARRFRASRYSYGSTAAIVTSVGLIVGFGAASVSKAAVLSSLLIIALADNLSDSLSIHIYQESENLEARAAFRATVTNFVARLFVALSFVAIVVAFPAGAVPAIAMAWGLLLLGALTFVLSKMRRVSPWHEVLKHLVVAIVVVAASRMLGAWIAAHVS